jgi:hypothetical protein
MNEIVQPVADAVALSADHDGGDAFSTIFGIAKPTMDAARRLKRLFEWFEDAAAQRRGVRIKLDAKDPKDHRIAKDRFTNIPDDDVMYGAQNLFKAAELDSAPEWWLHAGIGLTFDSLSNGRNVSPSVRSGIVDSMLYDEEVHDGYKPGFSAPVVYEMALDIRRITKDFLPMPAKILELCAGSRKRFARRRRLTEDLIEVRQAAEDLLIETGDVKVPEDEFLNNNFNPEEAIKQWLSGQRPVPLLSAPNEMPVSFEMPVGREKVKVGARQRPLPSPSC